MESIDPGLKIMAARLKEVRESAGYGPTEFALMIGISRTSLYRYEGDNENDAREIPITVALNISRKFGVSLDWLAGNSNVKYLNQSENELTKIYKALPEKAQGELFSYAIFLKTREGDGGSDE